MEPSALHEQLIAANSEIESLQEQLAEANQQLTDSQANERSLKRELRSFHATGGSRLVLTTQAHSPVSGQPQDVAELRNQIRTLEAQVKSLTQKETQELPLKAEVQALRSENETFRLRVESLTIENRELSRRVDDQAAHIDLMVREIEALKTYKKNVREWYQGLKSRLDAMYSYANTDEDVASPGSLPGNKDAEFSLGGRSSLFDGPTSPFGDLSHEAEGSDKESSVDDQNSEYHDLEDLGVANDEPLSSEQLSEKKTGLTESSSELNDPLSDQIERLSLPKTEERSLSADRPSSSADDLRAPRRQRDRSLTPPLQSSPGWSRQIKPRVSRSSSRESVERKDYGRFQVRRWLLYLTEKIRGN